MEKRLLFITSQFFRPLTEAALERLQPDCRTTVVSYDKFARIPEIYRQYQDTCDAVLLSGTSAKKVLQMGVADLDKPVSAFQVDSDGLHRDILRFAMERGSLDFSRIAMDFMIPTDRGFSVADFMAVDDMPLILRCNQQWIQQDIVRQTGAEELILQRIVELWQRGDIDCVICMYSGNVAKLRQLGIPCRCPFLSDAHLYRLIRDVLVKIELQQLHNNHPAIIQVIKLGEASFSPEQGEALEREIREFLRSNLVECVVQRTESCCSIITSLQVVRFLTEEFQTCRLWNLLREKLDFPLTTSYGIGTTVAHAMNNVQIASREAKLQEQPFAMDSNGNLMGPMNARDSKVLTQAHRLKLGEIAARASLSALTVQKILVLLCNRGSDKITTQELAEGMGTTVRNASRIMKNLVSCGFALPVYTQTTHSRGRPIQVYAIKLEMP